MAMSKPTLLFLCTGNACRSQMAEGLCRHFRSEQIDCYSAGIERHGLNLLAVEAMAELGIDISQHRSKRLDELSQQSFDIVVTVCGHADEHCPVFIGDTKRIHRGFDDPPKLAVDAANHEKAMLHYRRVRDEIKDYIMTLPESLA
tara:strand:+ start:10371 stop:10805 length:435 start_codon:yes stop_codon:yes gene_type:complete